MEINNVDDAINYIISKDCEGHAIKELSISIRNKLSNEYIKTTQISSLLSELLDKIDYANNSNIFKRKKSISDICGDISNRFYNDSS